jgi:glyoxylate/hydroxypyruvate reductase A
MLMHSYLVNILIQSTGLDIVPAIIAKMQSLKPEWTYHAHPSATACDYAIVWKPPAEIFAQHPKLKAVINYGAGVDAILAMGVVPAHIPIVRLEDAGMAQQMAQYAMYGVIHHQRRMTIYREQQARGHWQQHEDRGHIPNPTVGVMGLGEMGGHVAAKLAQFGYTVVGWSRSGAKFAKLIERMETYAGDGELPAFLQRCDVLVCLLPLTPQTRGILNKTNLSYLRRNAFLISAGRGGHMVDADVLAALDSGQLAGALLDVFHEEPLPKDSPFWSHPNVLVTPHVSATTPLQNACEQIVEKIEALERGERVSGIVDPSKAY